MEAPPALLPNEADPNDAAPTGAAPTEAPRSDARPDIADPRPDIADPRPNIADHLPAELVPALVRAGLPGDEALARRIVAAVVGRGRDFTDVRGLSRERARLLEEAFARPALRTADVQASPTDGFAKFLFECPDGARVEAVRIPVPCEPPATPEGDAARARVTGTWRGTRRRYVVCVSSQAGCALGCAFCATGAGGFRRNLRTWEIVAQVLEVRRTADRPVAGVVFMGMGEPLLNPDAVLRAARLFCDPSVGIAAEDITVSTAGIPAGIRRLAQARERFRLSVSLTSARPARRRVLMPVEDTHPTSEVVAAVREWTARTGRRAVIAWVMLGGPQGNCTPEEARALAELLDGLPVRLDLVELNGAVGGFVAPSEAEISAFRDELDRTLRQPVARRYSGGRDIDAACGMLAAKAAQRAPAS